MAPDLVTTAAAPRGNVVTRWWFAPLPLGRLAALRALAYLFVPLDVFTLTPWIRDHGSVPPEFYRELWISQLLSLPRPTATLVPVAAVLLVACAGAATALVLVRSRRDWWIRGLGAAVALLYFWWMVVAMSYGKVDHDRFAFLVLLAVLPTVRGARIGDRTASESVGWALRCVQVSVVLTYFLAAVAKLRFGGLGWVTSGTYARAVIRRGSDLVRWTLQMPWVLVAFQWFTMAFELASPVLLFLRNERVRLALVGCLYAFHLMTYLALGIAFFPHLVALAAFLPLERIGRQPTANGGTETPNTLRSAERAAHQPLIP